VPLLLHRWTLMSAVVITVALPASQLGAQDPGLGAIAFPTSAQAPEAQAHFVRGVAALHSFWYSVALEEFRAAAQIEPGFAMAYWGEAMAHNHPVWGDPQDTDAARQVLARLPVTANLIPRERAYLEAVKRLYGEDEKPERDRAYAEAMAALHRDHPDDLEAAAFHALALLGIAYGGGASDGGAPGDPAGLRTRLRAAAIALEVERTEPNHPGAAHYVLHAFDDPDHAVLALPAARRYASIAPAVPHARHMPSHIFLQLGQWPEAAAANEAAWTASTAAGEPDFHSLHWLLYADLQQSRADAARPLLATARASLARVPKDDVRNQFYGAYTLATMAATVLVETGQWNAASDLLPPRQEGAAPLAGPGGGPSKAFAALAEAPSVFARGLAAAMMGSADAQQHVAALEALRRQLADASIPFAATMAPVLEIQALEVAAAAHAAAGDLDQAIETLRRATTLEAALPVPPGPPPLIKPSHELLGELLLRAGRRDEAAAAFAASLFRHPGRVLSIQGATQAVGR
jgi:tetratricopeptide (TPR) repeat protein